MALNCPRIYRSHEHGSCLLGDEHGVMGRGIHALRARWETTVFWNKIEKIEYCLFSLLLLLHCLEWNGLGLRFKTSSKGNVVKVSLLAAYSNTNCVWNGWVLFAGVGMWKLKRTSVHELYHQNWVHWFNEVDDKRQFDGPQKEQWCWLGACFHDCCWAILVIKPVVFKLTSSNAVSLKARQQAR